MTVPDTITTAVLPIAGLFTCGAAHILIREHVRDSYESGEPAMDWLRSAKNYEATPPPYVTEWFFCELLKHLPHRAQLGELMRLDGEENNFHYDTDKPSWSDLDSITDADRQNPTGEFIKVVFAFPFALQPPTVVLPWGGEYAGQAVQAPNGYATAFLGRITAHRSDIRPGLRGRYVQVFEPMTIAAEVRG